MKRRAGAAALGLLALMLSLLSVGWVVQALGFSVPVMLLVALPLAGGAGGLACALVARSEGRPAVTILAFIYGSWAAVPLFTIVDRPHALIASAILCMAVGGVVLGGVIGVMACRGRFRDETPRPLPIGQVLFKVASGTIVGLTFLWFSFFYSSFWLALPAIYAYVVGRSALEGLALGPLRVLPALVDKLAFACVIGVTVRTASSQAYETNQNVLQSGHLGSASRLAKLEPIVADKLVADAREFASVKQLMVADTPLKDQTRAAAALEICADSGNPHCQVVFGMYLREVQGPLRDLERSRHYTWLALRDNHHPIAFNNMLVYLHEAAPEPYSEWLNEMQSPETVDRVSAGCGR